ncbi:hypothetical protein [Ornithinimicrobium sediminis]|uniref:hypothetical protein n=1 Tax=Ornithinimicrobium sediminis TaxID=2904603 RepID=UPI001E34E635|nr:hypothetical protein [Ornithinimicrobium sediminis]
MPPTARLLTALTVVAVVGTAGVLGAGWAVDALRDPVCRFEATESTHEVTPEQAANAATISMVAVQRDLAPRAATIALATAVQESKLRNISYGDADSLGLFQQRPSQGWGTPEQVTDPVYAAGRFYDALVEVEGWQDGVVTEVAQSVQRSAFPDAYADHEGEARVMATVLTGQTPAALTCRLEAPAGPADPAGTARKAREQVGAAPEVDGPTLTFQAPTSASAWATASWAVAHAEAESVVRVDVAGQRWTRGTDPHRWGGSGLTVDGSTTVVVRLSSG